MAITTETELRELLGEPLQRVLDKDRDDLLPRAPGMDRGVTVLPGGHRRRERSM